MLPSAADLRHHLRYLTQARFQSLDGLRALSILAVIWHHTAPKWIDPDLIQAGTHGVTLFFAISGFLISTLLLREYGRSGRIDLVAFYVRRAYRIFPLYYAVLALYVVMVAVMERQSSAGQQFFHNLRYFATYTSNLFIPHDGRTIFYFAWSLAVEEQFYLIWPAVLLTCLRVTQALWAPVAALLLGLILLLAFSHFHSAAPFAILLGALLALALHHAPTYRLFGWVLGRPYAAPLALISLIGALMGAAPTMWIDGLCVLLVAACVWQEQHGLTRFLTTKILVYIGSISYGMYLLQMISKNLVLMGVERLIGRDSLPWHGLEITVLTVVCTMFLAGLSFKYFESQFLQRKAAYAR